MNGPLQEVFLAPISLNCHQPRPGTFSNSNWALQSCLAVQMLNGRCPRGGTSMSLEAKSVSSERRCNGCTNRRQFRRKISSQCRFGAPELLYGKLYGAFVYQLLKNAWIAASALALGRPIRGPSDVVAGRWHISQFVSQFRYSS